MKKIFMAAAGILVASLIACSHYAKTGTEQGGYPSGTVKLPNPSYGSEVSVEEALLKRRSMRRFTSQPLTAKEISQLLWAAQGITDPRGFRTAPSAGGLFPFDIYIAIGNVTGIPAGVYRYDPKGHTISMKSKGDVLSKLVAAAHGQTWVGQGAATIAIAADYRVTMKKYGQRGIRYVHMEAGHISQSIFLQAISLNLGTAPVGAFDDERVKNILGLDGPGRPLYLMPVGRI